MTPRNISIGTQDLSRADLDCVPAARDNSWTVRSWLIACAQYDMLALSLYPTGPDIGECYFKTCIWLSRAFSAYMMIRKDLNAEDIEQLDDWFLSNAEWNRRQCEVRSLESIFPNRAANDYSARLGRAASGQMLGGAAYKGGPMLSLLSQSYNNRLSALFFFIAQIGVCLGVPAMVESAKRYVREWITYSVWQDGTQGEWARNNEYGYVTSGVTYGATNITLALHVALWTARDLQDLSLYTFRTSAGLWGTEAPKRPKTIWTAFGTHVRLLDGTLSLQDASGAPFNVLSNPFGRIMHASWYLPAARFWNGSASLDQWVAGYVAGTQADDPYGLWRGPNGIYLDVRT